MNKIKLEHIQLSEKEKHMPLPQTQNEELTVGLAQIAPVWLNYKQTLVKVVDYVNQAGAANCNLVVFGEALLPGYPFWIERINDARFNSPVQKELHAHYMNNGVNIEAGQLQSVCDAAKQNQISVYLGCIERASNRGGHSLYASLVYIDANGIIQSVHRKLMPTYDERLTWSPGDGHGLRTHKLGVFTVGGSQLLGKLDAVTPRGPLRTGRGPAYRGLARQRA
jgi:nitrilase